MLYAIRFQRNTPCEIHITPFGEINSTEGTARQRRNTIYEVRFTAHFSPAEFSRSERRVLKCRSAAADTKYISPTRGRQASMSEEER